MHYADDRRFAHPAALLVVTSDGRLSRVLSGLAITGADVRLRWWGLARGVGAIVDQVRLLCYGFGASVGFYADRIRILLAAAGVTLLAVGGGVFALVRASAGRRA